MGTRASASRAALVGILVYDAALKKIFSHRLMIELLIRRHVPESPTGSISGRWKR